MFLSSFCSIAKWSDDEIDFKKVQEEASKRFHKKRAKLYPNATEFSTVAEVSRKNLYKVESGEGDAKMSTIIKLAIGLNKLPSELVAELYDDQVKEFLKNKQ